MGKNFYRKGLAFLKEMR